jgi:protein-S-isoprenylcysteine O-methyltransferase Ste14
MMRPMATLETRIPPPVVMLLSGALAWGLARTLPGGAFTLPGRPLPWALLSALAGGAVAVAGIREFRRAGTTVNPLKPHDASALVSGGPFRYTRNPMYVGLALVLTGWILWLGSAWAALALPAFVLYITRFQIRPEERALEAHFGEAFRSYASRVRRWL